MDHKTEKLAVTDAPAKPALVLPPMSRQCLYCLFASLNLDVHEPNCPVKDGGPDVMTMTPEQWKSEVSLRLAARTPPSTTLTIYADLDMA